MKTSWSILSLENARLVRDGFFVWTMVFTLTGCSAINVKLGRRVDLSKTPVTSIEVSLPKGPGIAPGHTSPLVVTATQPDGKVLLSEGQGKGKIQWKELKVTATVVTVNQKGVISLAKDPRVSDGRVGHVSVTVPSQPGVMSTELDVPFVYNVAFVSSFSGKAGSDGSNGSDGTDGSSGSSGSMDPNNPSPGGNGGDGTNGSDGEDGGPGGNAPPVQVLMTLQPGSMPLIQFSVSASGHRRLYLVDPQGGTLTVHADGGPGGRGGRGGRGGQGGQGGIGMPDGQDGHSGLDGTNGQDGPPGKGGLITVTYDPMAQAYVTLLHLTGTNGPSPVFQVQAVAPLW